jgi:outer membrane protein OmpA-like peptidoglycan-associated protein
MRLFRVSLFLALAVPVLAQDAPQPPPLPSYFVLAPRVQLKPNYTFETYGETEFAIPHGDGIVKRGKHWAGGLTVSGVPDGVEPDDVWVRQIKPTLVNAGWTFLAEERGQAKIGRYQKDGHDTWLMLWAFASDDMRIDIVEVGPCLVTVKIPKPAEKPETVSRDSGNFPFLPPIPGSTPTGSRHDDEPMIVTVDLDKGQQEDEVAGTGSITKGYNAPPFESPIMFVTIYSNGLTQAGWKVVHVSHSADAVVVAHYAVGTRNIWAYLHGGGADYTITVADEGNLAAQLNRDCHVAVYGIQFDFNKSTIRADSEPTLQNVLGILKAQPDLKLEIQGHTDNVGGDEYNQKLSESRAASVVTWLTNNGIAPGRLTAKGYGKTQPIADNDSDEGRARNRRVELKKQGCTAR